MNASAQNSITDQEPMAETPSEKLPKQAQFAWGLLAGLTVTCVKILGPDASHVESLFISSSAGAIAFYVFASLITILLGGISGLFSGETKPSKILVFCSSVPALVSTALAPERDAQTQGPSDLVAMHAPASALVTGLFVTPALAQDGSDDGVCVEGTFIQQFGRAAREYVRGSSREADYRVIVASVDDYHEAVEQAAEVSDALQNASLNLQVSVGCRRPGNAFFPVIVGRDSDQARALEVKGIIEGANIVDDEPYLSNYAWREAIYTVGSATN